jgi:hypothetical protein
MVFSILFELGKTSAIVFLLNDYFRRHYPSEHNKFFLDIAFNMIYAYSYCQIYMNNGLSYINIKAPFLANYLKDIFENNVKKISTIDVVKDGRVVKNYITSEPLEYISDYDFLIFIDNQTNPSNIKIIRDEKKYDYDKCDIKFILIEFCISDKKYLIELANKNFNFYIENNIFDKNFFIYYLRYFHEDKIEIDETSLQMDEITLKIIDQNADIKTIDFTKDFKQYIHLNKNSYEIVTGS